MTIKDILVPVVTLGSLGAFFGVLLSISSKIFHVDQDERLALIADALPGANCGGCGYAGCSNCAAAILEGKAPVTACPVGGSASAEKIAAILGVDAGAAVRNVAHVFCCGGDNAKKKYNYEGIADCAAAAKVAGGPLECTAGCFGMGTCVSVCAYNALGMENGRAKVVHPENCVACGKCIAACPRHLISLVPDSQSVFVQCNSQARGAEVRQVCDVGCIGCMLCQKKCPNDAIHVENNLAKIDYAKCTNCGECVAVCPRKIIHDARRPEPTASTAAAPQTEQPQQPQS